MFHFIKSLEKEVYVAAVLVLTIIGLTTEGFGGTGKSAMTALAETPADSLNKEETEENGSHPSDREAATERKSSSSFLTEQDDSRKSSGEISQSHPADNIKYGQQVVGYFLEKDMKRQMEQDAGPALSPEPLKKEEDSLSRQDYQVLLKIVEAEAGICDEKGKILVANVILNRVSSDEFPDSVTDVVYQPSQFSPVSNGSINTCQVSSETVESVNRALKGEDYSQGALFFMNRAASRSGAVRWFDGQLTYLFGYQDHEFFK